VAAAGGVDSEGGGGRGGGERRAVGGTAEQIQVKILKSQVATLLSMCNGCSADF